MTDEDRRAAHRQDWENVRYQDGLRWSRFQTVSAIEAAYLAAVYAGPLGPIRSLILTIFASALVLVICLIAVKDNRDARVHLNRAEKLQGPEQMGIPAIENPPPVWGLRAHGWMLTAIWLLNVFNGIVVVDRILYVCRSSTLG